MIQKWSQFVGGYAIGAKMLVKESSVIGLLERGENK